MRRTIYSTEHEDFRAMVRAFLRDEVVPAYPSWEETGLVPARSTSGSASSA